MSRIEQSVEVNAPVGAVFQQWLRFEEFPLFMEGIKEVRRTPTGQYHWRAEVGGKEVEWDAELAQVLPDTVIGWRSTGGARNSGAVRFAPSNGSKTRVTLLLDYETEGATEKAGDIAGFLRTRVANDLRRFKEFMEKRRPLPKTQFA